MQRIALVPSLRADIRSFSTSRRVFSPVELAYDLHAAPASTSTSNPDKRGALVILHGLFGSKQNWRSLARALAQRTSRDVYTLVSERRLLGMARARWKRRNAEPAFPIFCPSYRSPLCVQTSLLHPASTPARTRGTMETARKAPRRNIPTTLRM
jgi:pimeloyl-ACP methyl ester carboxylesterase